MVREKISVVGEVDRAVSDKDAAFILGVSRQTLCNWRHIGVGPAYLKINSKMIRYRLSDLQAFMDSQRVDPNADPALSATARSVREALEAGEEVAA